MAFTFGQLVESILILMVFFAAYSLLFSRQASFNTNRFILLAGVISSIIFPFVDFRTTAPNQLNFYIELKAVDVFANGSEATAKSSLFHSYSQILGYIYLFGILIFSAKFVYQIIQMSTLFFKSEIVKIPQGKIVYTKKKHPVFSFLSWIFISSKSEHCNQLDIILNHEKVHVKQKHSIDLLLLELLAIVQWFNPVVWLYRKLVKQNHEFLADRGVIKTGIPDETYQELLLGNYKSLKLGFANSFNHSLTFKRLVMMKKNISKKTSIARIFIVAPLIVMAIYLISCSKTESLVVQADPLDKYNSSLKSVGTDTIYESFAIDKRPEFPGGDSTLIDFVAKNTKYPEQALKDSIQGAVYVRFVVTKTGEINQTSIMRKENPLLEEEAIRVVKSLPKWQPGVNKGKSVDVWFIIPIRFKLN